VDGGAFVSLESEEGLRQGPSEAIAGIAEPSGFATAMRKVAGRLRMLIALRMGPLLGPDDVRQETILEAYKSRGHFTDEGPGSFYRWMAAIAENRLRDMHKYLASKKRDPRKEIAAETSEGGVLGFLIQELTSPSSRVGRRELSERLAEGLLRLPEDLREVVLMRVVEDQSYRDIARRLECSPTTAQALYSKALVSLKKELQGALGS
jgi:RNA polymerase sigma-70 factor, ECF subfamily